MFRHRNQTCAKVHRAFPQVRKTGPPKGNDMKERAACRPDILAFDLIRFGPFFRWRRDWIEASLIRILGLPRRVYNP